MSFSNTSQLFSITDIPRFPTSEVLIVKEVAERSIWHTCCGCDYNQALHYTRYLSQFGSWLTK